MAVLYTKAVNVLWGRSVNLATAQAVIKPRKRVTKISITVTVLQALCWLPDVTSYLLVYNAPGLMEYGGTVYQACVIPVGIGTCLNPFVYALQSERFRIQMRNMIGCGSSSRRHGIRDNLEAPHPLTRVKFDHFEPRDSCC